MSLSFRISVVVPTFQRRDLVVALVEALERQDYARPFEVIVVVDGSSDGTQEALSALEARRFPLRIVSQSNHGLAHARNCGAGMAAGEILLFLDDDMEPDARLLSEHDRSHVGGAEVVSGIIPSHPDSVSTLLADGVSSWADDRTRRCAAADRTLRFDEIVNGQVSIARDLFNALGGFDERFTKGGSYGNEDLDFGYRLVAGAHRVVHNPAAISRQRYTVDAETHLRRYYQAGRADVAIVRKYPELAEQVFSGARIASRLHALVKRPVLFSPRLAGLLARVPRKHIVRRVDQGHRGGFTARLFYTMRAVEYWRGVHDAGGPPRAYALRVLCYHSIADLSGDPVMEPYGVPESQFRDHVTILERTGYHFIDGAECLRWLEGRGDLPRRPLLLTFDDCYRDLIQAALPVLTAHGVPAVAFAVSGRVGATSDWDETLGASPLSLLSVTELEELARSGVEVGGHSHTHRSLTTLPEDDLHREVVASVEHLQRAGLGPIRFFAYPYGEHDRRVRRAVAGAGLTAGFTMMPGRVHPGDDPYALRRIEILRRDVGWRFRLKISLGGYPFEAKEIWESIRRWARVRTRFRALIAAKP